MGGRTYGIVLAGGRGLRLNERVPKQFLLLGDRPVLSWSLETFSSCDEIDHLVAVLPGPFIPEAETLVRDRSIQKIMKLVSGGETRQESASNALSSLDCGDDDIIIFHDAARPFVTGDMIRACINETRAHGAAGVYVPVQDTIAEIRDSFVTFVPSRDELYAAQTPQGFRYPVILAAHQVARSSGVVATDDISLVRAAGASVKMIAGSALNFKITTELDYRFACLIAETMNNRP